MFVCDSNDRIAWLNAAAEVLLHGKAEALVGQPVETLLPERLHRVEGRPFLRYLLTRAPELDGRAVRVPVRRADGLEIVVEVTVAEVPDAPGGPELVASLRRLREAVSFGADPVERTLAPPAGGQQESERSEEPYRLLFENAPVGVFHFDTRGLITACNTSFVRTLGSTRQVLLGLDMHTLPSAEMVRCVRLTLAGQAARYEGEYRAATSGKVSAVQVQFSPVLNADGTVRGGVGIVEDVTERKRIEASLAHAREGAERLRIIVRDLKSFSRPDAEAHALVDVETVLDTAISLAWNELRHRARFVKQSRHRSPVWAHASRLSQVFVNLLVNAAQAIPEGADASAHTISVTTSEEEGQVRIEVSDTGVGIPPEKREHTFEPFWTDKPVGMGTGLGLSICHGIVTAHGGTLSMESTVGRGSTFCVRLPARTGEHAAPLPLPARPAPAAGAPRARILVIDDEVRLGWTLARALEHHDVVTVTSGREGLEVLGRSAPFDLILCDMMMPDLSGIDVYEALQRTGGGQHERIVFMTGGIFTARARSFLAQTSARWLEKPFRAQEVEELLRPPPPPPSGGRPE